MGVKRGLPRGQETPDTPDEPDAPDAGNVVEGVGRFSITRGEMGTFSDDIRQRWDRLQSCAEPV